MGECGATQKGDNEADRAAWAHAFTRIAKSYGVPCIWWDNGYIGGPPMGEKFGILDRREVSWPFESIAKAFLEGSKS
jgi:endoglucanase